jgi:hypothetical protein
MAENASVLQASQWGLETVPGTTVPANRRLLSVGLDIDPKIPTEKIQPMGVKAPTGVLVGKEHVEIAGKGDLAYNDLVYLLSSLLGAGATAGNVWTFRPNQFDVDDAQTFTIDYGSSVNACRFSYGLVSELGFNVTATKSDLTFKMIGQKITDADVTMTPDPTIIPLEVINPTTFSLNISEDNATFTKLTRVLSIKFDIKDRYDPLFTVDSDEPSFVAHVEKANSVTCVVQMEKDSVSDGYMTNLRNADKLFAQLVTDGPTIDGVQRKLDIRFPFSFMNPTRSQSENLQTASFEMEAIYDGTFATSGGFLTVAVTNGISAL